MCVNGLRSSLLSRASFLGAAGAAALPLFTEPARAMDALATEAPATPAPALVAPVGLSNANKRAADIASRSPFVTTLIAQAYALAGSISDLRLRAEVLGLLLNPAPFYMRKYPTMASRIALRDAMAKEGFVAADAPVEGLFPPVSDIGIAQPFWSAPGSDTNGHHAYPGGLCVHELFNARMAREFAHTYDDQYFDGSKAVNPDWVIAAAFYHDIMKSVVFQYNDDGTFFEELPIGATGGHHCLSGAEAIVRGHTPNFVTILLSAHAAPSLGDEAKVVTWCRAAAMIAGVDPIEFGLVRKTADGFALAHPAPIETFVSHLSDHDYVLTIHATHAVRPMLATVADRFGIKPGDGSALNWWRLTVSSLASNVGLYYALTKGEDAFVARIKKALA